MILSHNHKVIDTIPDPWESVARALRPLYRGGPQSRTYLTISEWAEMMTVLMRDGKVVIACRDGSHDLITLDGHR